LNYVNEVKTNESAEFVEFVEESEPDCDALDIISSVINTPVEIKREHYDQALSFYFDDHPICRKKSENGRMVDKILRKYGYRTDSLEFQEMWNDNILRDTSRYFARYVGRTLEDMERYILFSIKRQILKKTIRKRRFNQRFENLNGFLEKIEENCPSLEGEPNMTPNGGDCPNGGVEKFIFNYLEKKVSPIHIKIYELSYKNGMADKEIMQIIKIPLYSLLNMRRGIRKILSDNKFDILTELNITEDYFNRPD